MTIRTVTVALVGGALVLSLAACSGSATQSTDKPASPAAASTSAPPSASSAAADDSSPYTHSEILAARAIPGVVYRTEPDHNHVVRPVTYDMSPPIGGNHAQYWADCTGTVYPQPIANENAVHSLEHGALWITYDPALPADQVAALAARVTGVDRMFMSPYSGLSSPITLQTWGYQLAVDSANDPRIAAFIAALRFNPVTTPEPNATCSNPAFKANPSTPAQPKF